EEIPALYLEFRRGNLSQGSPRIGRLGRGLNGACGQEIETAGVAVVSFRHGALPFVSHSQIQGQTTADLEVVLHKEGVKRRLVGPGGIAVDQPAGGLSQQKRSIILADRSCGGIVQGPARVGSSEIITARRLPRTIIVLAVGAEIVAHANLV